MFKNMFYVAADSTAYTYAVENHIFMPALG